MGIVYVALLIVGAGVIALQLLLGGHDADVDDADTAHDAHGDGSGFLPVFMSLRFWTFACFGAGLTGTALHYLQLAGRPVTALLAAAMGLGLGLLASLAFRALGRTETTSGLEGSDAIGAVGRVLLPVSPERRGKIRIEIKGQTHDLLATTEEPELLPGTAVMIEEQEGDTVRVARVPPELVRGERG